MWKLNEDRTIWGDSYYSIVTASSTVLSLYILNWIMINIDFLFSSEAIVNKFILKLTNFNVYDAETFLVYDSRILQ